MLILYPAPTSGKKNEPAKPENNETEMKVLLDNCFDIRSIETLARLYIMIAEVLDGTLSQNLEYVLSAAYCVQMIWQVIKAIPLSLP